MPFLSQVLWYMHHGMPDLRRRQALETRAVPINDPFLGSRLLNRAMQDTAPRSPSVQSTASRMDPLQTHQSRRLGPTSLSQMVVYFLWLL